MREKLILVKKIASDIKDIGGNMYFVGGYVRDKLLGHESKDIDVEIFNITPKQLKDILLKYGEVDEVGSTFGILMIKGIDIDFAMPRTEVKVGEGHQGFEININPFLSLKDASKRRDFTINALMEDVLTGELIDLWSGEKDLQSKIIKHIDETTFIEDPLRVFRACQFASRFNFRINSKTLDLCRNIDTSMLAKERIFEELKKSLIKSDRPSVFFNYLYEMNQMDIFFKEIKELKSVPQSEIHHPEGDVWNHTMMVIDECSKLKNLTSEPLFFMLSGLCHDIGKPCCTQIKEDGKITSIFHDIEGVEISRRFLSRLTTHKKAIEYVTNMVELHMRANMLAKSNSSFKSSRKMFNKSINGKDLILLAKADHLGRLHSSAYDEYEKWLNSRLKDFNEVCSEPLVKGKDLIEMGYKPSREFSVILEQAYKLQMSGQSKYQIIKHLNLKEMKKA